MSNFHFLFSPLFLVVSFCFIAGTNSQGCSSSFSEAFLSKHTEYRKLHQVEELQSSYEPMNDWALALAEHWRQYDYTGYFPDYHVGDYGVVAIRVASGDDQTSGDALVAKEYERGETVYRENDYYGKEPDVYAHPEIRHFAQIVWKDSAYIGLGCALNDTTGSLYVVAAYHPQGNLPNEYAENVLKPSDDLKRKKKN